MKTDIEELNEQMEADATALTERWAAVTEELDEVLISPRRSDVSVQIVALAWAPTWELTYEDSRGRNRTDAVPAYPFAASLIRSGSRNVSRGRIRPRSLVGWTETS